MKAEQLFALMLTNWPALIDITDAELVGSDGMMSWALVGLEEEVSERLIDAPQLVQAAVWPFHQALHNLARSKLIAGHGSVSPADVNFEDFLSRLIEGLRNPEWSEELAEYTKHNR